MTDDAGMLIIGGGVASASAAAELRNQGYDGPATLVTRELLAPYHRPPISKGLLRGSGEDIDAFPAGWWEEHDVELLTRSAVMSLDLEARVARLVSKKEVPYSRLLMATGAMVRRLPVEGAALKGVHHLRAPMNADQLRADLEEPRRVVLVGGSFIAIEVAATLSALGHHCTMVMLESQCLATSFGGEVSTYVDGLLRNAGVEMVCSAEVAGFEGEERVTAVRTGAGQSIPADAVVVGVGATADVKLAKSAGLEIGVTGGIACDGTLRTSDEHVYAAGDACEYDSVLHGRPVRIEHERHAQAQGVTAARNMLGLAEPHNVLPYFWTDIGELATLEYVGIGGDVDREVVTGSMPEGNFTVWQLAGEQLVGAVTKGRPEDLDTATGVIVDGDALPDEVASGVVSRS